MAWSLSLPGYPWVPTDACNQCKQTCIIPKNKRSTDARITKGETLSEEQENRDQSRTASSCPRRWQLVPLCERHESFQPLAISWPPAHSPHQARSAGTRTRQAALSPFCTKDCAARKVRIAEPAHLCWQGGSTEGREQPERWALPI